VTYDVPGWGCIQCDTNYTPLVVTTKLLVHFGGLLSPQLAGSLGNHIRICSPKLSSASLIGSFVKGAGCKRTSRRVQMSSHYNFNSK
jgi:hypothetical protein